MSLEAFHHSEPLTPGVELELQLVNTNDYDLAPPRKTCCARMKKTPAVRQRGARDDEQHDRNLHRHLPLGQRSVGQLTPSAMRWSKAPTSSTSPWWAVVRTPSSSGTSAASTTSRAFANRRSCMATSKQFTIFGQHVHIGCPSANAALLMLHRMSRYIPHFIALSASSPSCRGKTRRLTSARLNSVFAFRCRAAHRLR